MLAIINPSVILSLVCYLYGFSTMGGWGIPIGFIAYTVLVAAYEPELRKTISPSSPTTSNEFLSNNGNIPPLSQTYTGGSSVPLFNNIFWAPPIKMDLNETYWPERDATSNTIGMLENGNGNSSTIHYHYYQAAQDDVDQIALEKQAEAYVENQFSRTKDVSRNRRENNNDDTTYSVHDNHGESSNYVQYSGEHQSKKKQIHYHQHKHLHEHDHLQEHKHKHLNDHQAAHRHEHMTQEDHKHQHEAKHQHQHKASHLHKQLAEHKHEHHQEHKHGHKNQHKHEHGHESKHEHLAKHEHQHKEEAKHLHELNGKHEHNHHHKHKADAKHQHNHWSDNKHWHDHHHKSKDHFSKIKIYYNKDDKHGW